MSYHASVIHATYGRPEKAFATMELWLNRSAHPAGVEYIIAANSDDPTLPKLVKLAASGRQKLLVVGDYKGSAPAWDDAASKSTGSLLIQAQDDVEPPDKWDELLCTKIEAAGKLYSWRYDPVFVAVSDGYRKDKLCCTAIMNRARYAQCREFVHAGYISMFSDDEVTIRAYADAADGKCTLLEARDIVFKHEHACHNPAVPMDDTYRRENSQAAYAIGGKLFEERNRPLIKRGLRTWK